MTGSGWPGGGVHRGDALSAQMETVAVVIAETMALLQAAAVMVSAKLTGSRKPKPEVSIDYASDRPQAVIKVRAGHLTSALISRSINRSQTEAQKLRTNGYGAVFVVRPGQRDPVTDDESKAMEALLRQHRDASRGVVSAPPGPPRDGHSWVQRADMAWVEVPIAPPGHRPGPRCSHCGHRRVLPERVVAAQERTPYAMTPKTAALEALTEAATFALGEGATLDEVRLAVYRAMGLAPDDAQEATS